MTKLDQTMCVVAADFALTEDFVDHTVQKEGLPVQSEIVGAQASGVEILASPDGYDERAAMKNDEKLAENAVVVDGVENVEIGENVERVIMELALVDHVFGLIAINPL